MTHPDHIMPFNPDRFVGLPVAELEEHLGIANQAEIDSEWAGRVEWRGSHRFAGGMLADPASVQPLYIFPDDIGEDLPENHPPFSVPNVDLIRYLGGGQFGWVYAGRVRATGLVVAVKVLRDDGDGETPRSAANEAINAAKLHHRNIMRVFDLRPAGGYWIILMELVRGDRLSDVGVVTTNLKPLLGALSDAVRFMGTSNIVHRDIKPENIVIRRSDGSPVIVDLGLSVDLTVFDPSSTVIAGTPLYMPPEAVRGVIDGAFDPYSLGVTAARAATGQLPIPTGSIQELFQHKQSGRFRQEIVATLGGVDKQIAEWIATLVDSSSEQRLAALRAAIF